MKRTSNLQFAVLPKTVLAKSREKRSMRVSQAVIDTVALDAAGVYAYLKTRADGLTTAEADARLAEHGQNILAQDRRPGLLQLFWHAVLNPLRRNGGFARSDDDAADDRPQRRAQVDPRGQGK
jgi:hypothetical protein